MRDLSLEVKIDITLRFRIFHIFTFIQLIEWIWINELLIEIFWKL